MANDLELAYKAITGKQARHNLAWAYYLGDHPLVYANERLQNIFSGEVKFTENWCAVVIDALKERIDLTGFTVPETAQPVLDEIYQRNSLSIESDDLHEAALVTGEAYLIIWPDELNYPEIYFNDPRLVHAFYQAERPREMRFAAKMWTDDEGFARMVLYYSDRLEYYKSTKKAENVTNANAFEVDEETAPGGVAENPYGQIPVFHFRTRRQAISEIADVIPIQNGVNKLLTDMMVAAEYGAFRQRWVISNSDTTALKNAPNEIWNIPAGDGIGQQTLVGEFNATDLGNYLDSISHLAGDIGRITRIPKHYFYSQSGDPSGEALIAMEAPLSHKATDRIERFEVTWKQAMMLALEMSGQKVPMDEIEPVFRSVHTVQPKTEAEIRYYNKQAGLPLVTTLRREGWTDAELEDMEADRQTEQAAASALGDNLLDNFEKGAE